jgi:Asp-tRNA(Asn)/Glu-tRNA(Gln) amidotransferase A subunit family amidase
VTALFSAMAGWDAEDLITFRSMGSFPQSDWSKELQVADLAGRRLGVLREMMYGGPAHTEGRAIFEQALGDLRKGGAAVVDPVLTGIDLKTQSLAGENRTAEYEKIAFMNAYLARLGPSAKFKTVDEMIEKVGREKLANALVAAPALPPPEKSPVYLARYRTREMFIRLFQEVMDRFALDALVLPYRTIPPERVGEPHPPEATNQLTSHFGAPAVVVPGGYAQGNLPIAIQFFGRHNDDLTVLKIAHAYERVSRRRRTPTSTPPLPGEHFEYDVSPSKK